MISNDKPIIMNIDDRVYYPYIIDYAETDFGGELETTPDYKGYFITCLLYTSPSPRDLLGSRMPSSA